MGIWLNGKSDHVKEMRNRHEQYFYIIGVVVVVLFIAGYFGPT